MNRDELEGLIARLPSSMMRPTRHANAFGFDLPWWDFRWARAEQYRRDLVNLLRAQFPVQLVHLDEDWYEDARATLAEPLRMATTDGFWKVSPSLATDDLLTAFGEGRWALYFYAEAPAATQKVPDSYFVRPAEAEKRLRACGACCLISSWEDDTDWVLAFDVREDEPDMPPPGRAEDDSGSQAPAPHGPRSRKH